MLQNDITQIIWTLCFLVEFLVTGTTAAVGTDVMDVTLASGVESVL